MATITPIENQGNLFEPLTTGELVVIRNPVVSATNDPESGTMPLPNSDWRHGLFGCFKHCCCSPVFWLCWCWCCSPILLLLPLAQTMTRMSLDPEGSSDGDYKNTFNTVRVILVVLARINLVFVLYSHSVQLAHTITRMRLDPCGISGGDYKKTFKTVFVVFFFFVIFAINISLDAQSLFVLKEYYTNQLPTALWVFYYIEATIGFVFAIYILAIGIRTRSAIRQKLNIPVGKCKGADDCCYMFWFACCPTQQLRRHTADYETYDAEWCSTPV